VKLVVFILILLALAWAAIGAPPPGADPNSALSLWVRGMHRGSTGQLCCSWADCRPTRIRYTPDGIEAWIGKDQYGRNAPDEWRPVPANVLEDTVADGPPPDMRSAWVCYYGERVLCAVLDSSG